ncbi:MAG: indolepyruvate oxidoreductase subunit beta [Desulfatiglandales bacterium]
MKSQHDPLNLIVCGVGGQGNILISRMTGRILTRNGYLVTIGETFGAAQRGGPVFSSLRISKEKYYGPLIPEGKAHVVLSLEPMETLRILMTYGNPQVITLTNSRPIYPVGVLSKRLVYPDFEAIKESIQRLSKTSSFVNATEMAIDLGSPIASNIIMLGALAGTKTIPLSEKDVEEEIKATIPGPKVELNLKALNMGINFLQ